MNLDALSPWLGSAMHGLVVVLLGSLLWRLRGDPERAWREREAKLTAILGDLRLLVAQGEAQARELDEKLAAGAERVERLIRQAAEPRTVKPGGERAPAPERGSERARAASAGAEVGGSLLERVRKLAEARVPLEEIARRLSVPLADVRVVSGLIAARRADPEGSPAPAPSARRSADTMA